MEKISIFLLPPLKSMLDSWCSLESTQYRRWLSKSWGGGVRLDTSYRSCLSTPLRSSLPAFPGLREQTLATMRGLRHKSHGTPNSCQDHFWCRPLTLLDRQGSPRVIPLGHSMLSETSVCRSAPLSPAFSIFAWKPQSDQYMNLKDRRAQIRFLFGRVGVSESQKLSDPLNI